MQAVNWKGWLPHLVALLLFLVVSYGYFPRLLTGYEVQQYDRDQWQGTAQELIEYERETGEYQHWATHLFAGMPAVLVSMHYPMNPISTLDRLLRFGARPASYFFVMMLGFYLLMLTLRVDPWLAIVGSVGYAFSTYFFIIVGAGHNAKLHALCYMAPMVGGLVLSLTGRRLLGSALFGVMVALSLVAGHPQITYYTAFILAALWVGYLVQYARQRRVGEFFRITLLLFVAGLLGIGANFNRLYQTWDYGKHSIRGTSELHMAKGSEATGGLDRSYATRWSYGPWESFNLFVPNLAGGASQMALSPDSHVAHFLDQARVPRQQQGAILQNLPLYWGPQPMTAGPVYIGAVIIFLFVLSLFTLKGPFKYASLAVSLLALLLAWGEHLPWLTNAFLDYFPGYNKFRTVSMILVILELTLPMLAFVGLASWLTRVKEEGGMDRGTKRALFYAAGITLGLALLIALMGPLVGSFQSPMDGYYAQNGYPREFLDALVQDRKALLTADAWRSFTFVLLSALLLWVVGRGKLRYRYFLPLLGLVVLVDLWVVNRRFDGVQWVSAEHKSAPFPKSRADEFILRDTAYFRVCNRTVSTFNDASTSYYHRSIGGYHGAKMGLFQDMVDNFSADPFFWNLFNVKYFIVPGRDGRPMVQLNPEAYGPVWLVDSLIITPDALEEMDRLPAIDTRRVALVRGGEGVAERLAHMGQGVRDSAAGGDTVYLVQQRGDSYRYHCRLQRPRFAVLSEMYYPKGWTASANGENLAIDRVDYCLRGVALPAGDYELLLSFQLPVYRWGKWVDFTCGLSLILGCIAVGLLPRFRGMRGQGR